MQNSDNRPRALRHTPFVAAGGLLGALAASSCCILPLLFFSLGISGAWVANLTALAPYQPYFLAVAAGLIGYGYWLVHRSRTVSCADGICGNQVSTRLVRLGLVASTVIFIAVIGFDVFASVFLNS